MIRESVSLKGAFEMAAIYRRDQDRGKKRSCWYIGYTDHLGRRRTKKGFSDRGETERLAATLELNVERRKTGLIDPELEAAKERRNALLSEHLAAFKRSQQKNSGKYAKLVVTRIETLIEKAGISTAGEIGVEVIENALVSLKKTLGLGHRTYNHYIQAMDSFCNWMVTTKRLSTNPLVGLERLNADVDVRHRRRALTDAEIGQLVESARTSGKRIQGYSSKLRARLYLVAYYTGLRRSELGSLTTDSFKLESNPPTVRVEAAHSKHRREDVLPLHPELVRLLTEWLPTIPAGKKLFPNVERKKTWFMVKKDLERVGIPYETADGIADFHAAGRHTHITTLLRNGASLPEAKQLARHSDVRMTMRYTHIGLDDQARAVRHLPTAGVPSPASDNGSKSDPTAAGSAAPSEAQADGWERPGSASGVCGCQNGAPSGTGGFKSPSSQSVANSPVGTKKRRPSWAALSGGGGNRTRVPQ